MKKSLGILMIIIVFGVALYFLLPNIKSMKKNTVKRNLITSAKIYGDEVKSLWNSDALYCETATGNFRSIIALPQEDYYVVVGKNTSNNSTLPVIKLDKVDDKYYGYVKIGYHGTTPEYSVFLTDGTNSVMSDQAYSTLKVKDVKQEKLSFTFDSNYHYCKGDK